jgi:hypothetical protein
MLEPPSAEAHGLPWDIWVVNTDGKGLRPGVVARAVGRAEARWLVPLGAVRCVLWVAGGWVTLVAVRA